MAVKLHPVFTLQTKEILKHGNAAACLHPCNDVQPSDYPTMPPPQPARSHTSLSLLPDKGTFLQKLPAEVQRYILAVHNTWNTERPLTSDAYTGARLRKQPLP